MSQQLTVSVASAMEVDIEVRAESVEERVMIKIYFGYMGGRAAKDNDLSEDDKQVFEQKKQEEVPADCSSDPPVKVANLLTNVGDEIDYQCHEAMEEVVEHAKSPKEAFRLFLEIVKKVFKWDEPGGPDISLGRIGVVMSSCYQLCKIFIVRKLGKKLSILLSSFLGTVLNWLLKSFIEVMFYKWLDRRGGWTGILTTIGAVGSEVVQWRYANHSLLFVAIIFGGIWTWSVFKGTR